MPPTETAIPTGYTKIPGELNSADLQKAQFDDIQAVGVPGSVGSYLIGKPKAASGLTPIAGSVFNTADLQSQAFGNIQQFGKTGESGSYLAGQLKAPTVTLSDGKTYSIDPVTGAVSLVTPGDSPVPGSETGTPVDSDVLKNMAGSPNTPESIAALIQSFEARNMELQKGILDTFKASDREMDLQKQIDDVLTRTQTGLFNIEGRPIPIEDIGGEQERLLRNSNILLMPLQQELTRLSGARESEGKAKTAALGFTAQNQQLQLQLLDEIQKPMRAASEATQKFVLDMALKYPDAGITIDDTAASASTKAASSGSFKKSQADGVDTQVVETASGTLLVDSQTGAIIRNYGTKPDSAALARKDQRASALADQFVGLDVVKNFNLISTAVATVDALPKDTATSADDQALLYAFAKAMDPNSVVREGEYNTIQKYAQSWLEQFGIQVQRVFENKPLFPETPEGRKSRQNLKDTIVTKYKAAKLQYENIRNSYAGQIDRVTGGTDGADYLIDFSQFNATGTGEELNKRTTDDQDAMWEDIMGPGGQSNAGGSTRHGVDASNVQNIAEAIGEVETPSKVFKDPASRYLARGTVVKSGMYKGDRAYGKYQIMGRNIPSWTKAALGRSLTVEQFLASPAAQDATATYHVAQKLKQYGNADDVASAWFTGGPLKKNAQKVDDNGTTAAKYVALMRAALARLS